MRAVRGVMVGLLVLVGVPAVAATPAPDDRTTTIEITPSSGPDRSTVVVRGLSDCALIDVHLLFTTYDGDADNIVVRGKSRGYDYAREKFPYLLRLTVPVNAAPGGAQIYAEPFCGPPEEYPPSDVVPFRVVPGVLALRVSPRRPVAGGRLSVTAATCDGARGPLTVRVAVADQVRTVRAEVDRTGSTTVSVRLGSAVGRGEVSLPRAATECRGSSPASPVAFSVGRSAVAGTTAATPSAASPAPSPALPATPPPSPTPVASATESPATPTAAGPAAADPDRSPWLLGLLGAAAAAALVGAVLALRRRRLP